MDLLALTVQRTVRELKQMGKKMEEMKILCCTRDM